MGVNLDILAIVRKRDDMFLNVYSEGFRDIEIDLNNLEKQEDEVGSSTSLVRGVAAALDISGLKLGGADVITHSTIPRASGLSTSAAFEVLIANVISFLYNDDCLSPQDAAKAAWWAENNYYGKPCGMMDQAACAHGGIIKFEAGRGANGKATRLNTRFTNKEYSFVITNTHSEHSDLTEAYANIVSEMKAVSSYFSKNVLSDVDKDEFLKNIKNLRESIKNDRAILRAIHFFGENERAIRMAKALEKNLFKEFLSLVRDSGDSSWKFLQNLYVDTNIKEQSAPIGLAVSRDFFDTHKGAERIQGGGFGGCIQAYVLAEDKKSYIEIMDSIFGKGASKEVYLREEKAGYIATIKYDKRLLT